MRPRLHHHAGRGEVAERSPHPDRRGADALLALNVPGATQHADVNVPVADVPEGGTGFELALVVLSREVGNTAHRWVAAEGGVATVMIVEVLPTGKGGGASCLAAIDADVGPFLEQGAVEAFDLAVFFYEGRSDLQGRRGGRARSLRLRTMPG